MLPTSSDPFDLEASLSLVDGNEKLLRQVFDQRSNGDGQTAAGGRKGPITPDI
jgi:hypothetical protein